jgi:hypothetical protein
LGYEWVPQAIRGTRMVLDEDYWYRVPTVDWYYFRMNNKVRRGAAMRRRTRLHHGFID